MSWLCVKAVKGFKIEGLGEVLAEKAFVRSPFLPIQSREDKPVGHGSAISASISSHAEHFYLRFKLSPYLKNIYVKPDCCRSSCVEFALEIALCLSVLCIFCCEPGDPTCFADCCGSLIFSIKSEGELEERGSCNSAYSFSFQHLKRCGEKGGRGDTHCFSCLCGRLCH